MARKGNITELDGGTFAGATAITIAADSLQISSDCNSGDDPVRLSYLQANYEGGGGNQTAANMTLSGDLTVNGGNVTYGADTTVTITNSATAYQITDGTDVMMTIDSLNLDTTLKGDLIVQGGDIDVSGEASLITIKDLDATSFVISDGTNTFLSINSLANTFDIGQATTVTGNFDVTGASTVSSTLNVTGLTTIGSLSCGGAATISGALTIPNGTINATTAANTMNIIDNTAGAFAFTAGGIGNLLALDTTNAAEKVSIAGGATLELPSALTNSTNQTWTLNDHQAASMSIDTAGKAGLLAFNTTNLSEAISTSGNFSVSGTSTLTGNVQASGDLTVNGDMDMSNGASTFALIDNTAAALDFKYGATSLLLLDSTNVSPTVTVGGDLTVTGDLDIAGTVTTTSTANVTIKDAIIKLADANTNTAIDFGVAGQYGASAFAGMYFDSSALKFEFKHGSTSDPATGTGIPATGSKSVIVADLEGNATTATSATSAGSATNATNWTGADFNSETEVAGDVLVSTGTGFERLNVTASTLLGRLDTGNNVAVTPANLINKFSLGWVIEIHKIDAAAFTTNNGFFDLNGEPIDPKTVLMWSLGGSMQISGYWDDVDTGSPDYTIGDDAGGGDLNRVFFKDFDHTSNGGANWALTPLFSGNIALNDVFMVMYQGPVA